MKKFIKVLFAICLASSSGAYAMEDAEQARLRKIGAGIALEQALRESAAVDAAGQGSRGIFLQVRDAVGALCADQESRAGESLAECFLRIAGSPTVTEGRSTEIRYNNVVIGYARRVDGHLIVQLPGISQIENNGCAMTAKVMGHVFDNFRQGVFTGVDAIAHLSNENLMRRMYDDLHAEISNRFFVRIYDKEEEARRNAEEIKAFKAETRVFVEETIAGGLSADVLFENGRQEQAGVSVVDSRASENNLINYDLRNVSKEIPHTCIYQVKEDKERRKRDGRHPIGHFVPFFIERLSDGNLGIVFADPSMYRSDSIVDKVEEYCDTRNRQVITNLINHFSHAPQAAQGGPASAGGAGAGAAAGAGEEVPSPGRPGSGDDAAAIAALAVADDEEGEKGKSASADDTSLVEALVETTLLAGDLRSLNDVLSQYGQPDCTTQKAARDSLFGALIRNHGQEVVCNTLAKHSAESSVAQDLLRVIEGDHAHGGEPAGAGAGAAGGTGKEADHSPVTLGVETLLFAMDDRGTEERRNFFHEQIRMYGQEAVTAVLCEYATDLRAEEIFGWLFSGK